MKRAIIIGATSGIGEEVAKLLIQQGWHIGIAGRREEALEKLQATAPGQIEIQRLDVTDANAPTLLETLIRKDVYKRQLLRCAMSLYSQLYRTDIQLLREQSNTSPVGRDRYFGES